MRPFRKILVPHDFSPQATDALRVAADLAGTDGRLLVLHAIVPVYAVPGFPPGEQLSWIPPPELVAETRRKLEALVARALPRRGCPRVDCRVIFADPLQAVLDAARGMDVIVMATVGRTGLAHLLIGSVAEKVVRHAPVPVLTVRPKSGRRARGGAGTRRRKRTGAPPRG